MIICAGEDFCSFSHRNFPHYPSWGGKLEKKLLGILNRLWHVNFMPQGLNPQLLKNLWNRAVVCIKSVVCLFFACTLPHEFLSFAFIFFLNLCLYSFASIVYAMTFWANYFFFLWTLSVAYVHDAQNKKNLKSLYYNWFLEDISLHCYQYFIHSIDSHEQIAKACAMC